jgi:hypothetical protein
MDCAERHEEMVGEKQNIGAALAEWWNREHQDVQPELEILAEAAGFDGGGEIDVGESDEARFDAESFGAAEAFERALLQDAQEFALRSGRESGDFVEYNRAAAAELETAQFAFNGAGESAALVSEKFAFDEIGWQAGAVNLQEGRIAARAKFVHEPREVIFAGAAFAGDQQSGWRDGDFFSKFKEAESRGVLGDPRQSFRGHRCERPLSG